MYPCIGHQPAVRFGSEFGLGRFRVLTAALYPKHHLREGAYNVFAIGGSEKLCGHLLFGPLHQIVRISAGEDFPSYGVDTVESIFAMVMNQTPPESRTN